MERGGASSMSSSNQRDFYIMMETRRLIVKSDATMFKFEDLKPYKCSRCRGPKISAPCILPLQGTPVEIPWVRKLVYLV